MEKFSAVNPRLNPGKGVTGAVLYVLGEGRDPITKELKQLPPGGKSRVDWISGQGFGLSWQKRMKSEASFAGRIARLPCT